MKPTTAKTAPAKPVKKVKPPSPLYLPLGTGLLLIVAFGLAAYLQQNGAATPNINKEVAQSPQAPSQKPEPQTMAYGFIRSITAPFKSNDRSVTREPVPVTPSVPLPAAAPSASYLLPRVWHLRRSAVRTAYPHRDGDSSGNFAAQWAQYLW